MSLYVDNSRDNLASNDAPSFPWGSSSLSDSWYSRRSKLEKGLLFSTVALSALCLGLIIGLGVAASSNSQATPSDKGLTKTGAVKLSASPCRDFYEYACGNRSQPGNSKKDLQGDEFIERLLDALSRDRHGKDPVAVASARALFGSCVRAGNETVQDPTVDGEAESFALQESAQDRLAEELRALGGWPIVEGDLWDGKGFRFEPIYAQLWKYISPGIWDISVVEGNDTVIAIERPKDKLSTNSSAELILKTVAAILGPQSQNGGNWSEDARLIFAFQQELTTLQEEEELGGHEETEVTTLTELQQLAGQFMDWPLLLEGVLGSAVHDSTRFQVRDTRYLKSVDTLLLSKHPRHLANYLLWRYVEVIASHLLQTTKGPIQRWQRCASLTDNLMGYATARLLVDLHLPKIEEFAQILHQSLLEVMPPGFLNNYDLKMESFFGFPGWILNDSILDHYYYSNVATDRDFYDNLKSSLQDKNTKLRHNTPDVQTARIWNWFFDLAYKDEVGAFATIGTRIVRQLVTGLIQQEEEEGTKEVLDCLTRQREQICLWSQVPKAQCANSTYTVRDAVADYLALSAAHKAYHRWAGRNETRKEPTAVDDRAFFLTYAKDWCIRDESESDTRSDTSKYRVNGPTSNSQDFSRVFLCQGEKMDRKNKKETKKCGFLLPSQFCVFLRLRNAVCKRRPVTRFVNSSSRSAVSRKRTKLRTQTRKTPTVRVRSSRPETTLIIIVKSRTTRSDYYFRNRVYYRTCQFRPGFIFFYNVRTVRGKNIRKSLDPQRSSNGFRSSRRYTYTRQTKWPFIFNDFSREIEFYYN